MHKSWEYSILQKHLQFLGLMLSSSILVGNIQSILLCQLQVLNFSFYRFINLFDEFSFLFHTITTSLFGRLEQLILIFLNDPYRIFWNSVWNVFIGSFKFELMRIFDTSIWTFFNLSCMDEYVTRIVISWSDSITLTQVFSFWYLIDSWIVRFLKYKFNSCHMKDAIVLAIQSCIMLSQNGVDSGPHVQCVSHRQFRWSMSGHRL